MLSNLTFVSSRIYIFLLLCNKSILYFNLPSYLWFTKTVQEISILHLRCVVEKFKQCDELHYIQALTAIIFSFNLVSEFSNQRSAIARWEYKHICEKFVSTAKRRHFSYCSLYEKCHEFPLTLQILICAQDLSRLRYSDTSHNHEA